MLVVVVVVVVGVVVAVVVVVVLFFSYFAELDIRTSSRLEIDCMCAGLNKKRGVEGARSPPRGGPPHLQTYSLLAKQKL